MVMKEITGELMFVLVLEVTESSRSVKMSEENELKETIKANISHGLCMSGPGTVYGFAKCPFVNDRVRGLM